MENMKVFKIEASYTDFDEYYSIVVVAINANEALEIAKRGNPWRYGMPQLGESENVYWEFSKDQYPLKVKEVNLCIAGVVDSSFRGS